jgi:hypothetical protein
VGHSKIGAAKIQETHKGLVWERLEVLKKTVNEIQSVLLFKKTRHPTHHAKKVIRNRFIIPKYLNALRRSESMKPSV